MLIINTKGGLGNQMYQNALYLTMKQAGKDVKLCTEHFDWASAETNNIIASHGRKYLIEDIFTTEAVKATSREIRNLSTAGMDFVSRALRKVGLIKKTHLFEEKMNYPSIEQLMDLDNAFLDGYWQRFDYYKTSERYIRESYVFSRELTGRNKEISKKIKDENSVSIHVRRNDYLGSSLYVIQNSDYYSKAIALASELLQKPVFYCFSDDINWCRDNLFPMGYNVLFVDWNSGKDSYCDMQLMSQCKANIVTNSSFSMWAAWLNSFENKIIVRPSHYYTDKDLDEHFFWPENWLTV